MIEPMTATEAWQDLLDKDDRTSPEAYPEMCLITRDELGVYMAAAGLAALANPPKHDFWGAGEPDCPREIKAGNGELHTLRCKRCGLDSPRSQICVPA